MNSSLIQFRKDIKQLSTYLVYLGKIDAVLKFRFEDPAPKMSLDEKAYDLKLIVDTMRSKKVLEYNLCIITLYGILERYVEDLCIQFIDLISDKVDSYRSLPDKIKNHHTGLTTTVIQKISYAKYNSLRIEDLIRNLNDCINNDKCNLNSVVFSDHSANFKHSVICDVVGRLNIDNLSFKLKNISSFNELLKSKFGGSNFNTIRDNAVFDIINDLADRRNDVSHGADNGSPILSVEATNDYVNFIKVYGESLYAVLESESLGYYLEKEYYSIEPIAVYANIILCVKISRGKVYVNDIIIVEDTSGNKLKRKILGIQVNKVNVDSVDVKAGENPVDIGLELDNRIAGNYKFYFKK